MTAISPGGSRAQQVVPAIQGTGIFFVVYINEAHPSDTWQMQSKVKEGVLFADPTTGKDREKVANSFVRNLHIAIPALIDSISNRVEQEYTGWPDRLYLIDKAGNIRFKTEAGPFGFDAKKLAAALRNEEGTPSALAGFREPFARFQGAWDFMEVLRWGKPSDVLAHFFPAVVTST